MSLNRGWISFCGIVGVAPTLACQASYNSLVVSPYKITPADISPRSTKTLSLDLPNLSVLLPQAFPPDTVSQEESTSPVCLSPLQSYLLLGQQLVDALTCINRVCSRSLGPNLFLYHCPSQIRPTITL